MKKHLFLGILLVLPFFMKAGVDREFIFDIHDATSTTEEYINEALIIPVYKNANDPIALSDDFAGELPNLHAQLPSLLQEHADQFFAQKCITFIESDDNGNITSFITSELDSTGTEPFSLEAFRCCFARGLREAERRGISTVHIALPVCVNATMKQLAQEIATVSHIALYEYTALKENQTSYSIKRICVHAHMHTPQEFKDVNIGLRIGTNLGLAVCQARDWTNTPSNLITPNTFAAQAAQFVMPFISKIETVIFEQKDLTRMGMGGLIGASQGSDEPCTLIMHYLKSRYPNVPTIALIGNGITTDSNGITQNISGAAAVLSALHVIAYRNIPANILVIAPLAEQGNNTHALQAGDFVTMSNGKAVEIIDNNAIGELMLADALIYATSRYKPDYIIDIAALTSSCEQTFGGVYAAVIGNNDSFIQLAQKAAELTGESIWQLPLNPRYAENLASINADLCNASSQDSTARTQTAACFLQNFVGNAAWVHLDIAGANPPKEYAAQGNSAFGVRLLVALTELIAQKPK